MKRLALALSCVVLFGTVAGLAQGKFSGYMFGDYFYNVSRDAHYTPTSAQTGVKDLNGFQFRRIYFAYDNDISETFTSRFRLEADQVSNTSDGKFGVAVKDAYLRWKNVFSGSDLIFGLSPTPAFDISEAAWGYRSLEKTIMDLRGIVGSRDLGVALRGKLTEDGMFNYWVMIANNAGQRPEGDKFKRYYLNIQIKPAKNLQITVYGDYASKAEITDPYSTATPRATVSNSVFTTAAFVGYKEPGKFNLGVEGFMASTAHGFNDGTSLKSKNGIGLTLYASVNVQDNLALVGRYDLYDPNTDSNSKGDMLNYFLIGLDCKPDKNVSIIPNVQIETYEKSSVPNAPSIGASVTGRVTFYYIFL
jgi:hypothetical protein